MIRSKSKPPLAVALFYASPTLACQMASWVSQRTDCAVVLSSARSASGIRKVLERAHFVVVNATEDQAQARETFGQAAIQWGAGGVIVYTETMHEGLELFVRTRGGLFLLGPMGNEQWEGLLTRKLGLAGDELRRTDAARQRTKPVRKLGKARGGFRPEKRLFSTSYDGALGVKAK